MVVVGTPSGSQLLADNGSWLGWSGSWGGGVVGITGRIPDVCLFVRVLGRVDIEVNLRPLPDVFNGEDVVELIKYIQYFKNSDE